MTSSGMGTNVICQVALVVRDIEATARAYADVLQVDLPEITETGPREETHTVYRGETTDARAKLAFFHMGPIDLELIEPIGGPSTWADHLENHGEGLHHIAFTIEGMDGVLAYLEGKGMRTIQRGDYEGGRYGYVDAEDSLKLVLELLENTGDRPEGA